MGLDGADYSYLTKKTPDSTGFFMTFNIPFKRQDVFNELLNDDGPLGTDGADSGVTYRILKPGREAGKLVRATPQPPYAICTGTDPFPFNTLTRLPCLAGLERMHA